MPIRDWDAEEKLPHSKINDIMVVFGCFFIWFILFLLLMIFYFYPFVCLVDIGVNNIVAFIIWIAISARSAKFIMSKFD